MGLAVNWTFSTYTFPRGDVPAKGGSGDWDDTEKLVEHDPLNANVTILTSWGFKSRRRTITGTCGELTRDQMRTFQRNATVAALVDSEARSVTCRIVSAKFTTMIPTAGVVGRRGRYEYTIEFMER